ncbi:MAG: riboflavin synthase [Planctomycetes bacterium]|nr:riboflavin synthase [Planctomycetota bacterium]
MFTGIIQEIGQIIRAHKEGQVLRYTISSQILREKALTGASIAVDGVCQTIVEINENSFSFDAIDETLKKTTLGSLRSGQKVHLEPAMPVGAPLDGHLVYGHVDGLGQITAIKPQQGRFDLQIRVPEGCEKYLINAGSICLKGVSLTIFKVEGNQCWVSLIPETLQRTTLESLRIGDYINIEVDIIGKWVEKLISPTRAKSSLEENLKKFGY